MEAQRGPLLNDLRAAALARERSAARRAEASPAGQLAKSKRQVREAAAAVVSAATATLPGFRALSDAVPAGR